MSFWDSVPVQEIIEIEQLTLAAAERRDRELAAEKLGLSNPARVPSESLPKRVIQRMYELPPSRSPGT